MEFMLILSEDPELVATDEQRQAAVQRVGEFAMSLVAGGTLKVARRCARPAPPVIWWRWRRGRGACGGGGCWPDTR